MPSTIVRWLLSWILLGPAPQLRQGAPQRSLQGLRPPADSVYASGDDDRVAVLELSTGQLTTWYHGQLEHQCVGRSGSPSDTPQPDVWRLPSSRSPVVPAVAIHGDSVLIATAGDAETRVIVLQPGPCRITAAATVPGFLGKRAAGSAAGWTLVRETPSEAPRLVFLSRDLSEHRETPPLEMSTPLPAPKYVDVLVAQAGSRVWLLPKIRYQVVEWMEKDYRWVGRTPRVDLQVDGFEAVGQERLNWLYRMLEIAPPASKAPLEEMIRQAQEGKAVAVNVGAVASASARQDRLAVLVRTNRGRTCRLDLWALKGSEPSVSSTGIPQECPGFIALSDSSAWLLETTGFREVHLPDKT